MLKKSWMVWLVLICVLGQPLMANTLEPQRVKIFETACNTYLYLHEDGKTALIIDPGSKSPKLEEFVQVNELTIVGILNTHGHGDHIFANAHYAEIYKADVYGHPGDERGYINKYEAHRPTNWLNTRDEILVIGNIEIMVLQTPGHSQGSVGFLIDNILFSGDTLFHESIGRTWGDNQDELTQQELESIRTKFFTLPDETKVFPGHGSSTTIKHEKENNPFLN